MIFLYLYILFVFYHMFHASEKKIPILSKYKFSAIPQMQRKLNMDYDIKVKQFKECMKRSKQSDI